MFNGAREGASSVTITKKQFPISGVVEIIPSVFEDERGSLVRLFDSEWLPNPMISWVQESLSRTRKRGTLRGLHFQYPPFTESKLIRITQGRMLWVLVDIRKNSPTYRKHLSVELDAAKGSLIYAEKGFAHGCISLSDNCDLVVLSDNLFSEKNGGGIKWSDKELAIDWKLSDDSPLVSRAHEEYRSFAEFDERTGGLII